MGMEIKNRKVDESQPVPDPKPATRSIKVWGRKTWKQCHATATITRKRFARLPQPRIAYSAIYKLSTFQNLRDGPGIISSHQPLQNRASRNSGISLQMKKTWSHTYEHNIFTRSVAILLKLRCAVYPEVHVATRCRADLLAAFVKFAHQSAFLSLYAEKSCLLSCERLSSAVHFMQDIALPNNAYSHYATAKHAANLLSVDWLHYTGSSLSGCRATETAYKW